MAQDEDQKAKDKMTEGMSEAGKHPTAPVEDQAGGSSKGGQPPGSSASDKLTEGMSEAGKNPNEPLEDQAGGAPS